MAQDVLYRLQLQNDKWYIGKTKNFTHRMDQHLEGEGAQWVKRHPMKACSEIGRYDDATWEETKQTLAWMISKGINNVRGAEYSQLAPFVSEDAKRMSYAAMHHLNRQDREFIEGIFLSSISSENFATSGCASSAVPPLHSFITSVNQPAERHNSVKRMDLASPASRGQTGKRAKFARYEHEESDSDDSDDSDDTFCSRCGRDSHNSRDCYASRDVDNRRL